MKWLDQRGVQYSQFSVRLDLSEIRSGLEDLRGAGQTFFKGLDYLNEDDSYSFHSSEPDHYWAKLDQPSKQTSHRLRSELLKLVAVLANCLKQSSLLDEADRRDLGNWTKSVRASLRLRRYYAWDTELLHDEGVVLGVQRAGQSDTDPSQPETAFRQFEQGVENLIGLLDLMNISLDQSTHISNLNPQSTANYEPDTAFVMMQIDPDDPEIEDRYNTIKDCFRRFRIDAVRADEIEHEDVITNKIREKIRSSEFLIADLTGERPSVYYEIGYAHALKRKVIMYRSRQAKLHFDIASYNCPEYMNLTDLKTRLTRRLEQITNRRPSDFSS